MAAKTALIIRHVPHEGVAGFRAPIEDAGFKITRIDVSDPTFSTLDLLEPDLLIMMGGPMGVYEQDEHPWISCQLRRLQHRLEERRPTLGVCFGAQMIAAALGAEVYQGKVKEIGFHPVTIEESALAGPLRHLVDVPVLHWHGDTFELPKEAQLLASSSAYRHQAFCVDNNILALQFHAEMGLDPRFDEWVELWPDAIAQAGTDADLLRKTHAAHGEAAVFAGRTMIAEWLESLEFKGR